MRGHALSSQRKLNKHWQSGKAHPRCILRWTASSVAAQSGGLDSNFLGYRLYHTLTRSNTNEIITKKIRVYSQNIPVYNGTIRGGLLMASKGSGDTQRYPRLFYEYNTGNEIIFKSTTSTYDVNTQFQPVVQPYLTTLPQSATTIDDGGITLDYFTRRAGLSLFTSEYLTGIFTRDIEYEITIPGGFTLGSGSGSMAQNYTEWAISSTDDGTVRAMLEDSIGSFEMVAELW